MRCDNRISGIDIVGDIPWGTHFSLFYQTKKDLIDILIPYFKAGLENNELCFWITPELLDVDEAITALKMTFPDLDIYLEKRQIEIIPYTYGYANENPSDTQMTLNHFIEKTNQALASGYDGLRYSGNIFWSGKMDWQDLICYEESLDKVIGNYHVLVLCAYFYYICEVASIAETAYNHKFILAKKDGSWEKIENSGRKRAEEAETKLENLVKKRTEELENAYKSLKEREESLSEAQKMAHIGDWIWDIKTDKAYWSEELYRIFKLSPQEAAPTYNEYLNYVHPGDLDYLADAFKKAAMDGNTYSIDHRIVLANGEVRIVHIQSEIIFDEKNIPARIKGIVQDITERKKAEEKIKALADIVESSGDAIYTTSLEGIITNWNKAAEQIYGYSEKEVLGKNVSILEPANLKGEIKQLSGQIKQGEKIQQYETLRLKKDGSLINVSITLSPVFDSSGKLMAISGIVRDITRRIKAEEALTKAEEARIKEIHHRIKNNLQVISSLLSLQAEKFNDEEVLEAFKESQNRVGSMALIHEELYKGDNIEILNFADYLLKLTTDLLNSYRVGRENINLKLDLEQVYLNIDTAIPLGIIVNELISNSLKHAFPNRRKGEIRISLQRTEDELNKEGCETDEECKQNLFFVYMLNVSDKGVGIPKEIDPKNAETLGLQLVNILVEQIDGCLEVKSDNGTEFTIWFNNIEI
jgi:PAS domain S-box-containing protein